MKEIVGFKRLVDEVAAHGADPDLREVAITWVTKNKAMITAVARQYLAYSTSDIEDFVSAAYEAALEATDKAPVPAVYEKWFWGCFRHRCEELADIPSRKTLLKNSTGRDYDGGDLSSCPFCGSSSLRFESEKNCKCLACNTQFSPRVSISRAPVAITEYREEYDDELGLPSNAITVSYTALDDLLSREETEEKRIIDEINQGLAQKALLLMTKGERRIWDYVLTNGCRLGNVEIARELGMSRQAVSKALKQSLEFVRGIFAEHPSLYTVSELSERTGYAISTIRMMTRYGFLGAKDIVRRNRNCTALYTEAAVAKLKARKSGEQRKRAQCKKSMDELVALADVAALTGYSKSTVRNMICYGFFRQTYDYIHINNRLYFTERGIAKLLKRRSQSRRRTPQTNLNQLHLFGNIYSAETIEKIWTNTPEERRPLPPPLRPNIDQHNIAVFTQTATVIVS